MTSPGARAPQRLQWGLAVVHLFGFFSLPWTNRSRARIFSCLVLDSPVAASNCDTRRAHYCGRPDRWIAAGIEMGIRGSDSSYPHRLLRPLHDEPGRRFLTGWTAPPMWPRPPTPPSRPSRTPRRCLKPAPGSQLALFATYSYHGGETLELEAGRWRSGLPIVRQGGGPRIHGHVPGRRPQMVRSPS